MELWLSIFCALFAIPPLAEACEEIVEVQRVKYRHRPHLHRSEESSDCGFGGYSYRYREEEIITVVCSNMSASLWQRYTSERSPHPPNLKIVDSTIPVLSARNLSRPTLFYGLTNLTLANLGIEEIEVGAFRGMVGLAVLILSGNKLKEIPDGVFDNSRHLSILDLSNNNIARIESLGPSSVSELRLNRNSLMYLGPTVVETVVVLDISDNPLKQLPDFSSSDALRQLRARNIELRSFDINLTNSTIVSIDLSGNYLEVINFDNLPHLHVLNLSNNRLEELHNWDKNKVDQIDLSNNPSLS